MWDSARGLQVLSRKSFGVGPTVSVIVLAALTCYSHFTTYPVSMGGLLFAK